MVLHNRLSFSPSVYFISVSFRVVHNVQLGWSVLEVTWTLCGCLNCVANSRYNHRRLIQVCVRSSLLVMRYERSFVETKACFALIKFLGLLVKRARR